MPLSWAPQPSGHLPSLPLTSLELDRSKLNSLSFLPPAHHPHSPFPRLTLPLRSLSWWMLTTIPSISLDRKILNSFSPASLTCSQSPSPDSYCFFLLFYHSFYCHHPCPSHLPLPPGPLQHPLNYSPVCHSWPISFPLPPPGLAFEKPDLPALMLSVTSQATLSLSLGSSHVSYSQYVSLSHLRSAKNISPSLFAVAVMFLIKERKNQYEQPS